MNWYQEKDGKISLNIYVIPHSSRSEIVGIYDDGARYGTPLLKIKLKSPPVDNAANEELVRFLAEKLKISKRNIEIVKGHRQKRKTVSLIDCDLRELDKLFH